MGAPLAVNAARAAASPAAPVRRAGLARLWKRPAVRSFVWQAIAGGAVVALLLWVWGNLSDNLARRSLSLGFGFLGERASFEMGDNLLGYVAGDSFLKGFAAGLVNTVQVAVIAILLTMVVGLAVALMRLSRNPLVSRAAWAYVEVARNTPLLLQLLFWHLFLVSILPGPRQAWNPVAGTFVSNRGIVLPSVAWQPAFEWAAGAAILGLVLAALLRRRLDRGPRRGAALLLPLILAAVVLLILAQPFEISVPALRGFNFTGGLTLSPEFVALAWALVFYQSAFAAETIRSGLLGVPRGTIEAAESLGLSPRHRLRFVVLPQALRTIIPPMASQFMSLTKSSSLAVAIGYPDLVRVSTVAISETGRAIECIVLTLSVYLALSLLTAAIMARWNARLAREGR